MILAIGPAVTSPPPVSASGGSILAAWLFVVATIYVFLQLRPRRLEVWGRRFEVVSPLFRHIGRDILAIFWMVANFVKARWQGKKFRDQLGKDDQWPWS